MIKTNVLMWSINQYFTHCVIILLLLREDGFKIIYDRLGNIYQCTLSNYFVWLGTINYEKLEQLIIQYKIEHK